MKRELKIHAAISAPQARWLIAALVFAWNPRPLGSHQLVSQPLQIMSMAYSPAIGTYIQFQTNGDTQFGTDGSSSLLIGVDLAFLVDPSISTGSVVIGNVAGSAQADSVLGQANGPVTSSLYGSRTGIYIAGTNPTVGLAERPGGGNSWEIKSRVNPTSGGRNFMIENR